MPRTNMAAVCAAMLATGAPLAFGQTIPTPTQMPPPLLSAPRPPPANHLLPGQVRASQLDGSAVYDRDQRRLGDIKDVIIDRDGQIAAVIINIGATLGFGGRHVAVGFDNLAIAGDGDSRPRVTVDLTRDQLKSTQVFDLSERAAASGSSTPPAERDD